jgi:ABC-type transport system involved in cytochrome c biogenesis permease component
MAVPTAQRDIGTEQDSASVTEAIRVAVPASGLRQDLRAINVVWRREIIRFKSDRLRAVTSLVQPVLFLFVLGTGLSSLASRGMPPGVDFRTFIYPGILSMSVLFTAIFSAASIVWDREFGFLREMLVAPVSRSAIVIGKCLGGATVATFQGIVILCLAGLAGVPYNPILILTVIGELLLLSFTLTAFGVMMAARVTQIQAYRCMSIDQTCPEDVYAVLHLGDQLIGRRAARGLLEGQVGHLLQRYVAGESATAHASDLPDPLSCAIQQKRPRPVLHGPRQASLSARLHRPRGAGPRDHFRAVR